MKNKKYKIIKRRQKILNQALMSAIILNLIVILSIIAFMLTVGVSENNKNKGDYQATYESNDHIVVISPANAPLNEIKKEIILVFCEDFTEQEKQSIIKIATAEIEGK